MFKKIKNKFLVNKKQSFLYVVIFICLLLFVTIPTPYEIFLPGGVQEADRIVNIENANPQTGKFYSTYVSVITKPSAFQYLIAKLNKGADILKLGEYSRQLSVKEMNESDRMDKIDSIYTSLIVAYHAAGKKIDYDESGVIVSRRVPDFYIFDQIRIGDVIASINGVEVKTKKQFILINDKIDCETDIKLTVLRDNKEIEFITKKTLKELDSGSVCKLGISLYDYYTNFDSEPKFTIADDSGYGSSAGLMQTLSIYNAITEEDLTHGLKIAGTGVIDINGNVLPIAGIKQKVYGAIKNGVDIYFAPDITDSKGNNLYLQALEAKAIKKSEIEIVPVKTLSDALIYLQEYQK